MTNWETSFAGPATTNPIDCAEEKLTHIAGSNCPLGFALPLRNRLMSCYAINILAFHWSEIHWLACNLPCVATGSDALGAYVPAVLIYGMFQAQVWWDSRQLNQDYVPYRYVAALTCAQLSNEWIAPYSATQVSLCENSTADGVADHTSGWHRSWLEGLADNLYLASWSEGDWLIMVLWVLL